MALRLIVWRLISYEQNEGVNSQGINGEVIGEVEPGIAAISQPCLETRFSGA